SPSEPEVDDATLWENTHSDIAKLYERATAQVLCHTKVYVDTCRQSKLDVRETLKFDPPAPHALGCRECGSKDLAAFCWKGCRNFTPLDELYNANESMVDKQQQLEATVYAQGIALHAADMNVKEHEQSLHVLQHEIVRLAEWAKDKRDPLTTQSVASEPMSSTLLAVKAMHHRFDLDGDGVLSMAEMNKLKSHRLSVRPVRFVEGGGGMQVGVTPEGLRQLYDIVGGSMLAQDLHTLGIHVGALL
ncbi:hypothetical protein DYB34_012398, partial [Aphanomyces astaci]